MAIRIPDNFMGKPIAGAMERVLDKQSSQAKTEVPSQVTEGFIYVPSLNLEIAKERTLQGIDWSAQKSEAHKRNKRVCTINEFREFVKYLRTEYSDKQEAQKILDEIYKVEGDWRAENLDAKFENKGKEWFINYHKFSPQGLIEPVREPLAKCFMENKTPGISLENWLANATPQGLPLVNTNSGELYYWAPVNGAVARFCANSGRAVLYCYRNPAFTNASLGVRAVRKNFSGGKL